MIIKVVDIYRVEQGASIPEFTTMFEDFSRTLGECCTLSFHLLHNTFFCRTLFLTS